MLSWPERSGRSAMRGPLRGGRLSTSGPDPLKSATPTDSFALALPVVLPPEPFVPPVALPLAFPEPLAPLVLEPLPPDEQPATSAPPATTADERRNRLRPTREPFALSRPSAVESSARR